MVADDSTEDVAKYNLYNLQLNSEFIPSEVW